jgi:hypothetical protein
MLFEARTGRGPEDFPEHSGLPFGNTPKTEACSRNPLTRPNSLVSNEPPQVKGATLHTLVPWSQLGIGSDAPRPGRSGGSTPKPT